MEHTRFAEPGFQIVGASLSRGDRRGSAKSARSLSVAEPGGAKLADLAVSILDRFKLWQSPRILRVECLPAVTYSGAAYAEDIINVEI